LVAGQAGQGVQLCSRLLGRSLVRTGGHVFVTQDLMSRIRGGHNFARVRVADRPVSADADAPSLVVLLDPGLLPEYTGLDATVLVETGTGERVRLIPFTAIARDQGQNALFANVVAAGAVMALLRFPLEPLLAVLPETLPARSTDQGRGYFDCARAGFEYVRERAGAELVVFSGVLSGRAVSGAGSQALGTEPPGRLFLTGAQALALGALAGGVRFFTNYPMSPATSVFEYVARHADGLNVICEQPEDEIAAINMAVGAAFAGPPALTCTSASGFSLMNEALSLAGMTETPLVICLGMRPGPATGLATRTAQADLLFALHAGHGEFPRIVLCPADAASAFKATARAVRLAEDYQTQVIVLFDQYLADASWTVESLDAVEAPGHAGSVPARPDAPVYSYRRYELTDHGISPRILPGTPDQVIYADSDEHTPEGHITESATTRTLMVNRRNRKLAGIRPDPPARIGPQDAQALVFCFGSTRHIVAEALERLNDRGYRLAMAHLSWVAPFPTDEVRELAADARRVFTVEGSFSAQLAQLLAQESRLRITGSVRKYDGRQFSVAEVESGLKNLLDRQ
jgi:2-oxoglutarate ferredoxin oxidoreductase subunit alpha